MKKKATNNSVSNFFKNKRGLLLLGLLIILFSIGLFLVYISFKNTRSKIVEKYIEKEFYEEMASLPDVAVERFMLWEGDSWAKLKIKNKGHVSFWYDRDKVPYIDSIDNYSTEFDCFYIDKAGYKEKYAFDLNLKLTNNNYFEKWFSLKVYTIKDLVDRYDQIVEVLNSFPKNPQLVDYNDSSGNRKVLKEPKEDFLVKIKFKNKVVNCDLYFID